MIKFFSNKFFKKIVGFFEVRGISIDFCEKKWYVIWNYIKFLLLFFFLYIDCVTSWILR